MDSIFSLILIILTSVSLPLLGSNAQSIKSAHLLDLFIRDYTFKSLDKHLRTGMVQSVNLPANLSGIRVDMVRYRCGSLRRYGAHLKEFHLHSGVIVHPCIERVMLIRQNLGYNWSSIYYTNYDLSGYKLVSPIIGLLAFNADYDDDVNSSSNPFQLGILAGEKPLTIDFTNISTKEEKGIVPWCASFEEDGRMTLAIPSSSSPRVCVAKRHGHFGLVIEDLSPEPYRKQRISQWKVAVGSTIGAALGAFLLGLLLVAMLVRVKKRSRMEELERRAYEEEALQVSMVGHVRAPMATGTRTTPVLEHEYIPPPR